MSARRLSMVTNSTLRGLAGSRALAAALGVAAAADGAAGVAVALVAGGSVLEQAAARKSAGTNERSRMGNALLLGLDLPLQTIELTFQILVRNAVRRVVFDVF